MNSDVIDFQIIPEAKDIDVLPRYACMLCNVVCLFRIV